MSEQASGFIKLTLHNVEDTSSLSEDKQRAVAEAQAAGHEVVAVQSECLLEHVGMEERMSLMRVFRETLHWDAMDDLMYSMAGALGKMGEVADDGPRTEVRAEGVQ